MADFTSMELKFGGMNFDTTIYNPTGLDFPYWCSKFWILSMRLIIADELDYLMTRDRTVLHDLFMLTTFLFSRFILIGIANAIDLADRFLPRLQSLNCKPMVVIFRAYSEDQILKILQERLMVMSCPDVIYPWKSYHYSTSTTPTEKQDEKISTKETYKERISLKISYLYVNDKICQMSRCHNFFYGVYLHHINP